MLRKYPMRGCLQLVRPSACLRLTVLAALVGCNAQLSTGSIDPPAKDKGSADGGAGDGSVGGGDGPGAAADRGPDVPPRGQEILPVVVLTVNDRTPGTLNDVKVSGQLRLVEDHDGTLLDLGSRPAVFESWIGISLRGSSSQGFPQKSFGIELRDAIGSDRKLTVLGMPTDADWGLVACWTDKPCMRNALAYTIGQQFGRWTPQFRFVEVVFNGVYQGIYQLTEVPRGRKNSRIPFVKPAPDAASGDITGSYLFSREAGGKGYPKDTPANDWLSASKGPDKYVNQMIYTYRDPDYRVITAEQSKYLKDYVASFEDMMKSPTWADATKGYRAWIDVTSWVDHALVDELTNNVDGYWKSLWFLKEPDPQGARGKLVAQPIWDFNLGFGNANYRDGWRTDVINLKVLNDFGGECASTEWLPQGPPLCDDNCCNDELCKPPMRCWNIPIVPFYWNRLWTDPAFLKDLKCRWEALRKPGQALSMTFINKAIDEWKAQLGPVAIPRHFKQWPALLAFVWPNPYFRDPTTAPKPGATVNEFFEGEVAWMRSWVERRLTYLDAQLPGACNQ